MASSKRGSTAAWLGSWRRRTAEPIRARSGRKSAPSVMLGMSYGPGADPLAALAERSRAAISVYAQGLDYHDIIKSKLKAVAREFAKVSGADVKVFVDTAPVMEKPLAQAAGIGWQGKHTNLVSRGFGSWLFLGAIFTTAALRPDTPESDRCGSCRRCLDICPTRAFPAPYRIDARRCISYLTIEHKEQIPLEFRRAMGNRIYGCDDCLAVCPWNKFAQAAREAKFSALPGAANPPLAELLPLDDAAFRARFRGSPIKRIGRDRFIRNVARGGRQFGRAGASDGRPAASGRSFAAGARHGGLGGAPACQTGAGRSAESEALCGRARRERACGMGLRLMKHLFVFGLGYSASAIAALLRRSGWQVSGTVRSPAKCEPLDGPRLCAAAVQRCGWRPAGAGKGHALPCFSAPP